jgi:hypothetical protein
MLTPSILSDLAFVCRDFNGSELSWTASMGFSLTAVSQQRKYTELLIVQHYYELI